MAKQPTSVSAADSGQGAPPALRVHLAHEAIQVSIDGGEPAVARNLSLGGAFVLLPRRLPIGGKVTATLHYEQSKLTLAARVTHTQRDGVGLAFLELSSDARRFVTSVIGRMLSDGSPVDDRWRAARLPVSAAIIFSWPGGSASAQLRDLSATGAFVVTDAPPPVGEHALVYLAGYSYSNGGGIPSELRGGAAEVVRHAADGFGCRFVSPSAEFAMAVAELLRRAEEEVDDRDES